MSPLVAPPTAAAADTPGDDVDSSAMDPGTCGVTVGWLEPMVKLMVPLACPDYLLALRLQQMEDAEARPADWVSNKRAWCLAVAQCNEV